jgi:Protein of unknown function (DUF2997)
MGKTEINISIDKDGTVSCEVKGTKGKGCVKIMQMIEQILGKAGKQQFTAEYFEEEAKIADTVKAKK